jgi:hypothetical protein
MWRFFKFATTSRYFLKFQEAKIDMQETLKYNVNMKPEIIVKMRMTYS